MKMTKVVKIAMIFYIFSALMAGSAGFIMGVYSNYLRAAGLDEFWVNMVNVAFFITITGFEIPTGIFADVFGRKRSFTLSCFILSASFTLYGFSNTFFGFVVAEIIGAIGKTFASGAFEAWLVDSLKQTGEKHELGKIMSRASSISRVAVILCIFLGGLIADTSMRWSFFLSGILFAVTGVLSIFLIEEHTFKRTKFSFKGGVLQMIETGKTSLKFMREDANFRFILGIGFIQTFAFMAPNMEWQKIFKNLGGNNTTNGFVGAFIQLVMICGALSATRLRRSIKNEKKQIVYLQICIGLAIALCLSTQNIYLVSSIFLIHEFGRGMMDPILDTFLHDSIPSEERATLASFSSMANHFGGVFGLVISGIIAKYFGITCAWVVAGSVMILATLLITTGGKKS